MKKYFILTSLLLSFSAQAGTLEFECEIPSFAKGTLLFQINDLRQQGMSYNPQAYTDYEGNEVAFSYSGADTYMEMLWMDLLETAQGPRVNAHADLIVPIRRVDGCLSGKIQLYQDSGYKYGYMTYKTSCGTMPSAYSKVRCNSKLVK